MPGTPDHVGVREVCSKSEVGGALCKAGIWGSLAIRPPALAGFCFVVHYGTYLATTNVTPI